MRRHARPQLFLLGAAGLGLLVLGLAQLLLPGIAAQRLRDRLARSGTVVRVEVDAFPAIELLWHHADRVVLSVASYRSRPGPLGGLLQQASDVGALDATVGRLDTGVLMLRDATLRKRGNELSGSARVTETDLRGAMPILQQVQPVASGDGTLTLRGTASLFGLTATVDAKLRAEAGRLLVAPQVPFGGLATLTLFDNPHVAVQGVGARPTADGFELSAQALLH